jgi:hypothetical protein
MDWNSLDNSLFSIVFYILLDKPTYIKEQKVDEWINERPTSACVQPGGRFFNSNLLLCQCRRKLLKEKDNNLRRHAPRLKPGLHKAVHVSSHFGSLHDETSFTYIDHFHFLYNTH